jgi:hypothetical protein
METMFSMQLVLEPYKYSITCEVYGYFNSTV